MSANLAQNFGPSATQPQTEATRLHSRIKSLAKRVTDIATEISKAVAEFDADYKAIIPPLSAPSKAQEFLEQTQPFEEWKGLELELIALAEKLGVRCQSHRSRRPVNAG
jgi:hypothetical protein